MLLILSDGTIEILEYLSKREYGYFKDLRNLINYRTNKYFSSTTISVRIKELVTCGAIEKIIASEKGRNVVAYKLTSNGTSAYDLSINFEEELKKYLKLPYI